jgi:tetratricopeptide (TPR) repeat protein
MSYINDALKKAQQEKDSRYGRYSDVISGLPGSRSRGRIKWVAVAVSMTLMLGAFFVWLATTDRQELPVIAKQQAPEKAGAAGQAQLPPTPATVVPAAPVARATEAESSTAAIKVDSATPAAKTAVGEPAPTVARTEPVGSAAPAKGTAQAESSIAAARKETSAPVVAVTTTAPEVGTLYREALAAQRNKKLDVAEQLYRRILTLDAQHVEAMNNLGVLDMGQGRQERAVALFSKAIAIKKDYVDPYYNLACLYAQRKDAAKSIAYLKSAIAVDRAVIDWVKTDMDMKDIRDLEAFKKLMVKEEK